MLNKNKTISEIVTQSKGCLNPIYSLHLQKMKSGKLFVSYCYKRLFVSYCGLNCVLQKGMLNL